MVIITFYRGHDDLLGEQKLKAGRSSQLHSHKHTWLMTKMRCQIQMISSQWVNQLVQCFHPDQLSEWFLDGLSFSFVQTIKVPRGWSLVTLRISWLLFWRHCEVDICFFLTWDWSLSTDTDGSQMMRRTYWWPPDFSSGGTVMLTYIFVSVRSWQQLLNELPWNVLTTFIFLHG